MTRIDNDMDWCELQRIADANTAKLVYRIARCQHGKTRSQRCIDCEGGYVTDVHTFANIGNFARLAGKALVAVSDDGEDVAYVPASEQHKF